MCFFLSLSGIVIISYCFQKNMKKNKFQVIVWLNKLTLAASSVLNDLLLGEHLGKCNGSSEYNARVWSLFSNMVCLRHLFISTAVSNFKFILKILILLYTCTEFSGLLSNISTMGPTHFCIELIYVQTRFSFVGNLHQINLINLSYSNLYLIVMKAIELPL